jgi:hypothetical protein
MTRAEQARYDEPDLLLTFADDLEWDGQPPYEVRREYLAETMADDQDDAA